MEPTAPAQKWFCHVCSEVFDEPIGFHCGSLVSVVEEDDQSSPIFPWWQRNERRCSVCSKYNPPSEICCGKKPIIFSGEHWDNLPQQQGIKNRQTDKRKVVASFPNQSK